MIKILIYETDEYWIESLKLLPYKIDFCFSEEQNMTFIFLILVAMQFWKS